MNSSTITILSGNQAWQSGRQPVRQRISHHPTDYQAPSFSMTVDYPGSANAYQRAQAPIVQPHFTSINVAPVDQAPVHQVYIPPTTTTTEDPYIITNPQPYIVEEEVEPLPAPAVRAPIQPVQETQYVPPPQPQRRPQRTRQQQSKPVVNQRFSSSDQRVEELKDSRLVRTETEEERLLREEQNRNAHYAFGTSIQDDINDHSIHREEVRDGLALRGMYSYSDGYFKRTIHYEADENGYRVVKEEIEPIGDGPQFNPEGVANVESDLHDNQLSYSITARDFVREKKTKENDVRESNLSSRRNNLREKVDYTDEVSRRSNSSRNNVNYSEDAPSRNNQRDNYNYSNEE